MQYCPCPVEKTDLIRNREEAGRPYRRAAPTANASQRDARHGFGDEGCLKRSRLRNGAADAQHQANQMALMGVANAQQKAGEMTIKNVEEVTARSRKVIDSMVEESKRRIERLSMVTLPDRLFYYCKWMAVILVLIILVHVLWGMLV